MKIKEQALRELEAVIEKHSLPASRVGRDIAGDPSFVSRFRDPDKSVTTKTLDAVISFVLRFRHSITLTMKRDE